MEKEEWRWIKGHEGLHQVSSLGRVRSFYHKGEPRLLTPYTDPRGYQQMVFTIGRKPKTYWLHRLVATTFIPNPENKPTVNHKDTIKTNNAVTNLEWATSKENSLHGYRMGVVIPPRVRGEEGYHKLTEQQVLEIRRDYIPRKNSHPKLATKYGVDRRTIEGIILRRTWKHI